MKMAIVGGSSTSTFPTGFIAWSNLNDSRDDMVEGSELDWIAQKASELLVDKVKDGPLIDRDIKLAFEIFAEPRLKRLSVAFADERERARAVDHIMTKLQEYARRLNAEHWSKSKP